MRLVAASTRTLRLRPLGTKPQACCTRFRISAEAGDAVELSCSADPLIITSHSAVRNGCFKLGPFRGAAAEAWKRYDSFPSGISPADVVHPRSPEACIGLDVEPQGSMLRMRCKSLRTSDSCALWTHHFSDKAHKS